MRQIFRMLGGVWMLALVLGPAGTAAAAAEKIPLAYKDHSAALSYQIDVKSHHVVFDHGGGGWRGKTPERSHHEVLSFDLKAQKKPDGVLSQIITFTGVNGKGAKLWGKEGDVPVLWLKREQIVGSSQLMDMDALGKVVKATGAPHFMSPGYKQKPDPDGPPMDLYRVLTMIFPQFSPKPVGVGDSWVVRDRFVVGPAEENVDANIQRRSHKLEAKIRRDFRLTFKGMEEQKGYRVARIAFQGKFGADIKGIEPNNGHYVTATGQAAGEFLFAPEQGLLVGADFKSKFDFSYAMDGVLVGYYLTPKERISLLLEDRTTPPVPWRAEQQVRLELKKQTAGADPSVKTVSR